MPTNAKIGIELFLDKHEQFKTEFDALLKALAEKMGTVSGGATFDKWAEHASKAASSIKETVAKVATDSVDAQTRANQLIAEQEAKYQKLKEQYAREGTQELLNNLKHLEDETAKINGAIKNSSDKETKAALQTKKDAIQEETRLMRQLAKDTEEVQHLGAGARSGLLGVGRNLILGGGEYTGQIKKLGQEQKQIMLEMENAAKKESEAELALKKAQVEKEKGIIKEAEFEEIESMKRLEVAQAKADQIELTAHKRKMDVELKELKEKNEASAEKSEGGILKGAMGGLGGLAAVGGASAAATMLFEKGKETAEREEEISIGLKSMGLSGEAATKALENVRKSSSEVSKELALNHAEVESATAVYLKMGGTTENLKQKQEDIAALAKRTGSTMEIAAKMYAKAGDPDNMAALGKANIFLTKNMTTVERATRIHEGLAHTLDGMKEAANGPIGSFAKFKDTLDTLMETGGSLIFGFLTPLFGILGTVAGAISSVIAPIQALIQGGGVLGGVIKFISIAIAAAVAGFVVYSAALAINSFLHGGNAIATGISTAATKAGELASIAMSVAKDLLNGSLLTSAIAWVTETAASTGATIATVAQTVATWALNAAMIVLTSPITLVVVAIAALAAAVVYAYKNFQWFHNAVDAVGNFLKNVLWPVIETGIMWFLKFGNPIGWLVTGFKALYDHVGFVHTAIDAIIGVVKSAGSWLLKLVGITTEHTDAENKNIAATEASTKALEEKNKAIEEANKKNAEYIQGLKDKNDAEKKDVESKVGDNLAGLREIDDRLSGKSKMGAGETKESLLARRAQYVEATKKMNADRDAAAAADHARDLETGTAVDNDPKAAKTGPVHKEAAGSSLLKQTQRLVKDNKELEETEHQHSEVTIANYRARLAEIEKLGTDSGAKALAAENTNYENKLKGAKGSAALLKKLEADHLDAVEKLESKGANDLKDSKLLLAKEIRVAAKKIADDDFEDKKTALDKENVSEREYKDRTISLQIDHNKALMLLLGDNLRERDKLEDANRKLEKLRRDDNYKEEIDSGKVKLEQELGVLAEEHAKTDSSNREFEAKQYAADLQAAKDSLELARTTYGEKSREFDAFNKALEKLQHDHNVKEAAKDVADRKEANKLRAELLRNTLDRELSLEDAHYEEEVKKFSDNEEMKSLILEQHNKRRSELTGKYYTEQNAIGGSFFRGFNSMADQGLGWLETRWYDSTTNQKTAFFQAAQAVVGAAKGMVSAVIQEYERKAAATLLSDNSVVGSAIASAAATAGAWLAAGASMIASSAIWIGKNLAVAASSMVSAVASAVAWLSSTLGPFALAAIPAAVAGLYGAYVGAKKLFGFEEGGLAKGARGFQFGASGEHSGVFAENPKSAGEVFIPLEKVSSFVKSSMPPIQLPPIQQSHQDLSPLLAKFDELHGAVKGIQRHTILDPYRTQLSLNQSAIDNNLTY